MGSAATRSSSHLLEEEAIPAMYLPQTVYDNEQFVKVNGGLVLSLCQDITDFMGVVDDDHPAIIVKWNTAAIEDGLIKYNSLSLKCPLPVWLIVDVSVALTATQLQSNILNYCTQVTQGKVIKNFVVSPNTKTEVDNFFQKLAHLCEDEFLISFTWLMQQPLAEIFITNRTANQAIAHSASTCYTFPLPPNDLICPFQ